MGSRWDALKPPRSKDPKGEKTFRFQNRKRPGTSSKDKNDRKEAARAQGVLEKNGSSCLLSSSEARERCIALHEAYKDTNADSKIAVTLAEIILKYSGKLTPELIAHNAVSGVFLPHLERQQQLSSVAVEEEKTSQLAILNVVCKLLREKGPIMAAIMAPLVDDVTVDGRGHLITNPIRCRLFQILEHRLSSYCSMGSTDDGDTYLETSDCLTQLEKETCRCLSIGLLAAKEVDGTKGHANNSKMDVNVALVQRFVSLVLSNPKHDRLKVPALELLYALLQRHPDTGSSIATCLFLEGSLKKQRHKLSRSKCSVCGYNNESAVLLDLIHSRHANEGQFCLAVDCAAELIKSIPLCLWLGVGESHARTTTKRQSSSFQNRVVGGLQNLIIVSRCCLLRRYGKVQMDSLSDLIRTILQKMPFDEIDNLNSSAFKLIESLATLQRDRMYPPTERDASVELLIGGMGGHVTPQGNLTKMSLPIRLWLAAPQGHTYVEGLFLSVKKRDSDCNRSTKLLRAMLRSYPKLILASERLWTEFKKIAQQCQTDTESQTNRLAGFQLVEALLLGRRDFGGTEKTIINTRALLDLILPLLSRGGNSSCTCASSIAYGSLLSSDWREIAKESGACIMQVRYLLSICGENDYGSKVKREACKSVGDVCTHFYSMDQLPADREAEAQSVCDEVCQTMIRSMDNANASVRSMSVFAVGNLANVLLRNATFPTIAIDPSTLSRLAVLVQGRMDDQDEKVVGNAIRSIGHVTSLALQKDYLCKLNSMTNFDSSIFLGHVLSSLSNRVRAAVALAQGQDAKRSWKQRSAIKKHGWGACNSLAILFSSEIVLEKDGAFDECALTLFDCVASMRELNEKVVVAAMHALGSMNVHSLSMVSRRAGSATVGSAIASCVLAMRDPEFNDPSSSTAATTISTTTTNKERLCCAMEDFLFHLLHCASTVDAKHIITSERISAPELRFLYQWMVKKECAAQAFDRFALVMQDPQISVVDVQIEQWFSSKAIGLLLQQKNESEGNEL